MQLCGKVDTLVIPKLDRLARSVPDARAITDQLEAKGVKLALGASVHDPTGPMGKMFFNILATFAEFEADLIRMRPREGMAIARAKGKLRGKQPKLSENNKKSWENCTPPVTIPSPISPNSLPSQGRLCIELYNAKRPNRSCSIPDDHIDPRRSAFFMARSVLRDIREGV